MLYSNLWKYFTSKHKEEYFMSEYFANNAFMTMHDTNFNANSYLYHYSSFEKATKNIFNNNLRFSNIFNLNDTTEYKPKIIFSKNSDNEKREAIYKCCQDINRHIKICCFTQDNEKIRRFKKQNDMYFTDYTGRGFALPRMWAQYATNNKGVCFILNKSLLEKEISGRFKIIYAGAITYVERYKCFRFTSKTISDFSNQVLSRNTKDSIVAANFFSEYPDYIKENYFTKLLDWRNENEYRIALFSRDGENLSINNLNHFLEGIIVGEDIDETDETIIKKLLKHHVPIKKIIFLNRYITLK